MFICGIYCYAQEIHARSTRIRCNMQALLQYINLKKQLAENIVGSFLPSFGFVFSFITGELMFAMLPWFIPETDCCDLCVK